MFFWIMFCLFASLFLISFKKERRLFRNAIYLTISLAFLALAIVSSTNGSIISLLIIISLFFLLPLCLILVSFVFITAGVLSIKREGFSLPHSLSIVFGLGIWGTFWTAFLLVTNIRFSTITRGLLFLVLLMAAYILFTFTALFIYSLLYQLLPKNKNCDFIIVHGAGLISGDKVSPLLAGRLNKGIQVFEHSGRKAAIVVSGGQGGDEKLSEAQAMKNYLTEHGIPETSILMEDKSTTTMENMEYSKKIMDGLKENYRCIFVTNDYHVFRTGTYARKAGLKAEGVGCKTAFYFWPNAFIREYIAVIIQYKLVPLITLGLWAVGMILSLMPF